MKGHAKLHLMVLAVTGLLGTTTAKATTFFSVVQLSGGDTGTGIVAHSVNNVGGVNSLVKGAGTGVYTLTLGGMFNPNLPHTIHVQSPHHAVSCQATSEGSSGTNYLVLILCDRD